MPDNTPPRVNNIALARFEQWALPRMAKKLPMWVTPDKLTILGLLAAILIGVSYMMTNYSLHWLWVASLGFVLNWFGDSLDGTLARVRDIQRPKYGFYVDHQTDAYAVLFIFGGLALSPLLPAITALMLLIGYLLMMLLVYIVTISKGVFKISFGKTGPTEARLFIILTNTVVWITGDPEFAIGEWTTTLFGLVGALGAGGLILYYVIFSGKERAELAKVDPPRPPGPNSQV